MKKALLIVAIVTLALVPVGAYALIVHSPARADVRTNAVLQSNRQNLTEQQQADLEDSRQQMIEVRKASIEKMVQDGLLSEEQGQLALERLDEMADNAETYGYSYGYGMCGLGGYNADYGYYGRGMMRGYDWN